MTDFYKILDKYAKECAEDWTTPFREGDKPGEWNVFKFDEVVGNYPWVYVNFKVKGPLDVSICRKIEDEFAEFCSHNGAVYLNMVVHPYDNMERLYVKFRLLYREDLQPGSSAKT